ncbi:MAG: tetratricopeptide repeat protein [Candidatus Aminicenantes bacterium]|nr:MAG: tetratricopeptide repeat protein [Candidatus Aminicenantes bacterium]
MANLIKKYPVPLIFKKILKDNLSGHLVVKGENFSKKFLFSNLELQYATSDLIQERLGEILYTKGKITREQFIMLHKMKEKTNDKFGKLLVHHRILNKQELFSALQEQMKTIAMSIFSMTSGEWTFTIDKSKIPDNQKFKIGLPQLIIEGSQNILDFSYYKKRFNYRAPITLPIPEPLGQLLSPDDIRFYVKLSKCNNISSEQILSLMDIPEKLFWQRISLMYLLNIIDFTDFRIDSELQKDVEFVTYLHDRLKANSMDHYELLQLKDTSQVSDVRDKYFSFSKQYNPETLEAPPGSQTEEKVEFVLEKAQQAFDILSDEDKKKAYDTGKQKRPTLESFNIQKEKVLKARKLYLKAHSFYEQKKYHDAVRLLEEAVQLDPGRASYFLLLGLSQTRIASQRPLAEKNLLKAAEMETWNADPVFYLGQLYWLENMFKKAEKYFRKALEINMEHTLAAKMIRKIEKSSKKKPLISVFKK